ncbi:hypothetical protein DSM03_101314 [Leeuwenhoekiella aestuarii]|uniref:TonB-like protein n=1 Tax=Leeuwenhoekiella aestuarii TaxID=2249426 RepID=A0A4V1KP85_9FLAO|nr:hypothetical protein [Leeuwenhoekiella aestuarii]RXG14197.1 hypothetical protein DSM04_104305 [Leeuwenhoekiella aestuarii]RXG18946.1 hypothetical protein DSM03_101314 [Leeuwenhoekiella aestuarii]
MKKMFISALVLPLLLACASSKPRTSGLGNFMATMQVDEPIPGVCDNSKILALLPFEGNGQVKAQPPLTKKQLSEALNAEVTFIKDKPNYSDTGMVNLIVNCEGTMVRCQIDNKTQSPELDQQIVAVFSKMKDWKPGTYKGTPVDSSVLYRFTIENGVISL